MTTDDFWYEDLQFTSINFQRLKAILKYTLAPKIFQNKLIVSILKSVKINNYAVRDEVNSIAWISDCVTVY